MSGVDAARGVRIAAVWSRFGAVSLRLFLGRFLFRWSVAGELDFGVGRGGLGGDAAAATFGFHRGAPAVAFHIEFEDGRPMHESVDGGQRHGLLGEDRPPLAEGLVGGDEQGAVFLP